ncbi:MAG: trypsin-like peptidase domain-containing protein [Lachnospiraceae bacterium]|nr:trypsin-like peptidase domain-containing protein [Lachnospiraceae bacterium]
MDQFNNVEHQWQPASPLMMPETNTPKKKKEKKPTTVGKIVAICTVFMMITVLLNSVILIKFYDSVKDDFLTYDEYSALNIKSTSDTINNMVSENKDNLSVSQIAEAVMPSVVAITSTSIIEQSMNPFFGFGSYQVQGAGSGIIVGKNDTELLIVTNNHVVDGTTSLTVSFTNDITIEKAYVKGTSSDNDIAVVAIPLSDIDNETLAYIKIATLGDSDSMKVGDGVVAIGNALGYGQSLTVGYVSAKDREITTEDATLNVIQTDAAINGGNSGGALLNMNGEVIGINVAKSSSSGSSATVEGMGYAIPISEAKEIIEKLSNKETRYPVAESERGYLGVKIITSDESSYEYYNIPQGAYIREFTEDSAASKAGLVVGDVIIAVEGDDVDTSEELIEIVSTYKAGETITVTVMSRDGNEYKKKDVEITLGAKSNES